MKRSAFITMAVAFAVAVAGSAARAQSPSPSSVKTPTPATVQKNKPIDPRDSASIADVQRAADDLVIAVQQAVKKITENPELKVAALKLATSSVNAAQVVVAQQAATLQATLDALAREVAAATATQQSKIKTH